MSARAKRTTQESQPQLAAELGELPAPRSLPPVQRQGELSSSSAASFAVQLAENAVDPAAARELEAFRSQHHTLTNHQPSTGIGLFDVDYDPVSARMEVRLKVAFDFQSGSAADFPDAAPAALSWTDAEKARWRDSFIAVCEGRWGGKYLFQCTKPGFSRQDAYVDVEVDEVARGWHYELRVTKIPEGEFRGSEVGTYPGSATDQNYAELDSEDIDWTDKGTTEMQKGAVHEFGHMVGLDDEYGTGTISHEQLVQDALGRQVAKAKTDDVMSAGNQIEKQHYVTFLEALQTATVIPEWEFKG